MDNVININDRRKDNICPYCEWRNATIDAFIDSVKGLNINSPEFRNEIEDLIEYVEYVTEKETLRDIGYSLLDAADDDDDYEDE